MHRSHLFARPTTRGRMLFRALFVDGVATRPVQPQQIKVPVVTTEPIEPAWSVGQPHYALARSIQPAAVVDSITIVASQPA